MDEQQWKQLNEMMDVSDRWSYNPIKREIVFFWWKVADDEGALYKAKGWFHADILDFMRVLRENRQSYRATWFRDGWQFEPECCLEEN